MRILRQAETRHSITAVCREYAITEKLCIVGGEYTTIWTFEMQSVCNLRTRESPLEEYRIVADQAVNSAVLKQVNSKKMVSLERRRRAVTSVVKMNQGYRTNI